MTPNKVKSSRSPSPEDPQRLLKRRKLDSSNSDEPAGSDSVQEIDQGFQGSKRIYEAIYQELNAIEADERSLEEERDDLEAQVQLYREQIAQLHEDLEGFRRDKEQVTAQLHEDLEGVKRDKEQATAQLQKDLESSREDREEETAKLKEELENLRTHHLKAEAEWLKDLEVSRREVAEAQKARNDLQEQHQKAEAEWLRDLDRSRRESEELRSAQGDFSHLETARDPITEEFDRMTPLRRYSNYGLTPPASQSQEVVQETSASSTQAEIASSQSDADLDEIIIVSSSEEEPEQESALQSFQEEHKSPIKSSVKGNQINKSPVLSKAENGVLVDQRFHKIVWKVEYSRTSRNKKGWAYLCNTCAQKFKKVEETKDHVWWEHYGEYFHCCYCDVRASSRFLMREHIKECH